MPTPLELFNHLLEFLVQSQGSDLHIKTNTVAYIRIRGKLKALDIEPISSNHILEFATQTIPKVYAEKWKTNSQIDYIYQTPNTELGRFRVNIFYQRGLPSMVFRHVKNTPPTLEELNHDVVVFQKLCECKNGLVIVSGPTGVGKSSTLAAMLNYINTHYEKHIVTLEEPIEYSYQDKKSIFNQREVGIDTPTFPLGLTSMLRQDPDVILIGEMRDQETFEAAMNAAETGHLVLSTLHANNIQQALERIFDFFPSNSHLGLQRQLSSSLKAIVSQKLVTNKEGTARIPVVEMLVMEALAKKVILEGNFQKIEGVIEASRDNGSKTFNQDLCRLVQINAISTEDALRISPNPQQLEMNLKGVFVSTGGIVS